jgi:hypothetical protein
MHLKPLLQCSNSISLIRLHFEGVFSTGTQSSNFYSRQRHRVLSAAMPQPKSKQTFHHEGREEHEVRKLKYNNFRILRVLRALRGDIVFTH